MVEFEFYLSDETGEMILGDGNMENNKENMTKEEEELKELLEDLLMEQQEHM